MFLISLLLASTLTTKADVPRMSAAELHALMQKGEAVAVDVRGTVQYELEHVAGAVWMPLGVMSQRAGELPEEKLIVPYCTCKAEETSLEAAMLLSSIGFPRVAVLHGGYPAWKESGLPVESNRKENSEGRLAPPAAVTCNRNDLTVYAGAVRQYRREMDKTSITIETNEGTIERVTLRHTGSDDPSQFFLIEGTPFTASDWNRIERKKGELLPLMNARAWVCTDGTIVIDWRPPAP